MILHLLSLLTTLRSRSRIWKPSQCSVKVGDFYSSIRQRPAAVSTCGIKRYCREMTSCAGARFYWSQCGLTRLDGDHDGIPCERLGRWQRSLPRWCNVASVTEYRCKFLQTAAAPSEALNPSVRPS